MFRAGALVSLAAGAGACSWDMSNTGAGNVTSCGNANGGAVGSLWGVVVPAGATHVTQPCNQIAKEGDYIVDYLSTAPLPCSGDKAAYPWLLGQGQSFAAPHNWYGGLKLNPDFKGSQSAVTFGLQLECMSYGNPITAFCKPSGCGCTAAKADLCPKSAAPQTDTGVLLCDANSTITATFV